MAEIDGEKGNQAGAEGTRVPVGDRFASEWSDQSERNTAIALGVLTTICLSGLLVPSFDQIPHFDDTAYIRSGHWLAADGTLRVFAWGPLVSVLHAIVYVVVQESPNWFVWTAAGGRLATYGLFCTGLYLCVRSLRTLSPKPASHATLVIGLTWPIAASFFATWNASDYLFMALSALALSRLLVYLSDRSPKHLVWGSVFVGLAALARPDGLILAGTFAVLSYATHVRGAGTLLPPGWQKSLAAAVVPAALLVVGYLVLYGAVTGSWGMGVMSRTYQAFEQGHGVIFSERYSGNVMAEGYQDVRALFGTRDENNGSVLRAMARNPIAFLERLAHSIAQLPEKISWGYGGPLTIAFLFLASRGGLTLWRSRQRWTLGVLLGWHLHLLSYFVTFWSPRYVRFAFVALTLLAGIGASAIARNWGDWRERTAVAVGLGGLAVWLLWNGGGRMWGDLDSSTLPVSIVLLLAMALFVPTLSRDCQRRPGGKLLSLLAGLAMVFSVSVAAGRFPVRDFAQIGMSPPERAVAAAAETLPPGTPIASYGVKLPAAARRPARSLGALMNTTVSASALEDWQVRSDAGAIYLNPYMRRSYGSWFDYLLKRLEGDTEWVPVFSDEASHTWLLARRSLLEAPGVWHSRAPALRSGFDVYVLDDLLVYVKEGCDEEDAARRFFVHVAPADPDVLPEPQRATGIAYLDFDFDHNVFRENGRCVATRMLPGYDIHHIRTGQYRPGKGRFWQGRIEFEGGAEKPTTTER